MDKLTSMTVFAKVASTRSFSKAARELGLSQATISKHVLGPEGWLVLRLLQRATRRVALTDDGAGFLALTRSPPPKGRARWTLVLLEDQVVERATSPAQATIRSVGLKRIVVRPHLNQQFVIPPEANAAFVANMGLSIPDRPGRSATTAHKDRHKSNRPCH